MVNWQSKRLTDLLAFFNAFLFLILLNQLASDLFFRVDLTDEGRYTLKPQTKEVLSAIDDEVFIEVFLSGDLNAGFSRFKKSIEETLEEFAVYSGNRVTYVFTDPAQAMGDKARQEFMRDLAARGVQPINVIDSEDGERSEKLIFPGALVSYGGMERGVMLLKGNKAASPEEEINQSIEGIEYELINAISQLITDDAASIGWVTGHEELDSLEVRGFMEEAGKMFLIEKVTLDTIPQNDVLILAKPRQPFRELEKYHLDQFIMRGGKVLFLLDRMNAETDSLTGADYVSLPLPLNLDDLLFKYGLRINQDLVQDRNAGKYPVITGQRGGRPQIQLLDFPYFPLVNRFSPHPLTRNLDAVLTRFVSSMDTVKAQGISKTPLMFTSSYTRKIGAPVNISMNSLRNTSNDDAFDGGPIVLAYLLEGKFTSLFKNRFVPAGESANGFLADGKSTRIIVIPDGDIIRNAIQPRTGKPLPLGLDPFTNYTFANQEFLINAVRFLQDPEGLIQTRAKQIKLRPLDRTKIKREKLTWQLVNLAIPLVLLIGFGVIRNYFRIKKFARLEQGK